MADETRPYIGYRSAGRRPESQQDRRASADAPLAALRGLLSGVLGAPGDLESLVRMLPGLSERTVLPTSSDIERRLPLRSVSETPVGRAFTEAGTLGGGFYTGPGAPLRAIAGLPSAVSRAGRDFALAAGDTVSPLTVYHGSPHKFEKFDASKIGTGEGAQAYGHGLYFAESPEVADSYKKSLERQAWSISKQQNMDGDVWVSRWENAPSIKQMRDSEKSFKTKEEAEDFSRKMLTDEGALYTVDLPDEKIARMLDWDKPLGQQSKEVQAALLNTKNKQLRAIVDYANSPYSTPGLDGEVKTMGEAIKLLGMNTSPTKGSAMLAKQGIPGIRYLDSGSRGASGGTSNFVVFPGEEDALTILKRTGGESPEFSHGGAVRGYQAGGVVNGANSPTGDFDPARIDAIVDELHALNAG